jgi:hypothetical protein
MCCQDLKIPYIYIGRLLKLNRNEALRLSDYSHQAPRLISGVVRDNEYPLTLSEYIAAQGRSLQFYHRALEGGFDGEKNCLFILMNHHHRHSLLLTLKLIMT